MKKLSQDKVKCFFYENKYKLIDKYKDAHSKLSVICPKGHTIKTSYANFYSGHRCNICNGGTRTSEEKVKKLFIDNGYKVFDSYKNWETKIKMECNMGHKINMSYGCFKAGHRCPICLKSKGAMRNTQKEVELEFKKRDYKLVDIYKNNKKPLKIICNHNHKTTISFDSFKRGSNCKICYLLKKKNPNLNGEDRIRKRKILNYSKWVKDVKKLYNEICLACDSGDNIQIHHIKGFADFKKGRVDIKNGCCLCKKCHILFHKIYGKTGNNINQLMEFKEKINLIWVL